MRFQQANYSEIDSLSKFYPVDSVYISVGNLNPVQLFGFGTWEEIAKGKVLVGYDGNDASFNQLLKEGGSKEVTLTEQQIPSHTHLQNPHNHLQDPHTHIQNAHNHTQSVNSATTGGLSGYTPDTSTNTSVNSGYSTGNTTAVNQNATAVNQAATAINQNTGGGQPHNNLQPYLVVKFWRRVA